MLHSINTLAIVIGLLFGPMLVFIAMRRYAESRYTDGYHDGWNVCDQNYRQGGVDRPIPPNPPAFDQRGRNPNIFPAPRSNRGDG